MNRADRRAEVFLLHPDGSEVAVSTVHDPIKSGGVFDVPRDTPPGTKAMCRVRQGIIGDTSVLAVSEQGALVTSGERQDVEVTGEKIFLVLATRERRFQLLSVEIWGPTHRLNVYSADPVGLAAIEERFRRAALAAWDMFGIPDPE